MRSAISREQERARRENKQRIIGRLGAIQNRQHQVLGQLEDLAAEHPGLYLADVIRQAEILTEQIQKVAREARQ